MLDFILGCVRCATNFYGLLQSWGGGGEVNGMSWEASRVCLGLKGTSEMDVKQL